MRIRNTRSGAWREWHRQWVQRNDRLTPTEVPAALDVWLDLAGAGNAVGRLPPSPDALARLRDQLLAVLDDETGHRSLVPPSAAPLTQEEWDDLAEAERDRYRLAQLRTLDPRLLRRTIRNPAGPFGRSGSRPGHPRSS